ncbi:MAG: 23S rRNA (pseudouridine(1915)-N(3))-methyltransferase RlmH [Eubacteriales bacterium]|nr:23S rRNA (pseudouridine(1915)-N(3))-methyltransferase RlmH [Eubacteriales bacterium]
MQIRIIAAGKLRERHFREGVAEYVKRLGPYTRIEVMEVADEAIPQNASVAQASAARKKEGARMLEKIGKRDYVVALAVGGRRFSSEAFADFLDARMQNGDVIVTFVIGGSTGLSTELMARANISLSFSEMTFPHQLMRVILTEQIYRAFKIIHHEPYHK